MAAQHQTPETGHRSGSSLLRLGAIAAVLVLGVVGARARASGYLPHVAGPPGGLVLGVIRSAGIGVITAGLLLLLWGRRPSLRTKVAGGRGKRKLTQDQRRRVLSAVLIGTAVGIAYQIVLRLIGPPPPQKQQSQPAGAPIQDQGNGLANHVQNHPPGEAGIGTYVSVVIALLALVGLAVILLRKGQVIEMDEDEEDEEERAERVARAMHAGQEAVRDRTILDPREAIVACFAAMESALAGVGGSVAPRLADTPTEVLERGITGARLPAGPSETLLGLFREARFSPHPMREQDREGADRALAELLDALGTREETR
jgi:hypothetical protein